MLFHANKLVILVILLNIRILIIIMYNPSVLTEVVTPFNEDTSLDLNSMEELIRFQFYHNTGIILFGTTGECPTLQEHERNIIMEMISNKFNNIEENFVIGVGGNNTKECIYNIKEALKYGFNKFMLTTPYYNKPTQVGLSEHFKMICNEFPESKFILYNVPGRTSVNLLPQTVLNICTSCKNVIAIKEASGDLSVLSNHIPQTVNLIVKLCDENNYNEAFQLYSQVDEMIKILFSETNPTPIKYVLMKYGIISTDQVRLPLVKMQSIDNMNKIVQLNNKLLSYYFSKEGKY